MTVNHCLAMDLWMCFGTSRVYESRENSEHFLFLKWFEWIIPLVVALFIERRMTLLFRRGIEMESYMAKLRETSKTFHHFVHLFVYCSSWNKVHISSV